ncbi:MAG: fused MFS/spermidine synthase [Nitrospirota bacterium]
MTSSRFILYGMFFLSGIAGLVYEVLWMRYFQLLFGNTAKAAATVLTVFFLGMAVGSLVGGRLAHRGRHPLMTYGWLELGIAFAAAPVPWLVPLYERLLPASAAFDASFSFDALRFFLALVMTLPAGIFLGATFPIMGTALIDGRDLGRSAPWLYGLNTLGALGGVALTGFVLPNAVGVSMTYALAVGVNLFLAVLVLGWLGRSSVLTRSPERADARPSSPSAPGRAEEAAPSPPPGWLVLVIAGGSGMALIGLEVLWTRMFALILQNSVYSFSAIVLTVLSALSLGALIVGWVAPRLPRPLEFLGIIVSLAALSTALIPVVFFITTGGTYFAYGVGWPSYLYQIIALIAAVIFIPALLAGATLPLLWRLFHRRRHAVGVTLGTVTFWNLVGAIMGAAGAGFVLIPTVGLWTSVVIMAALLLALAQIAWWSAPGTSARRWSPVVIAIFVLTASFVSNPSDFPVQHLRAGERLLYLNEGEDAVVSVVEDGDGARWLKSNNAYRLGATVQLPGEKRLGHLPLLLHPDPKSAAFVGIGTGISMSAGLDHPIERLVGVELLPGVLDALPFFSRQNQNLLNDARVNVAVGDGRVYLRTTAERFDVIVADLFVPWHAGTGSLYTLEHFQAGRDRLNPAGIFCQWLPLYQMSELELGMIAATFTKVFPHVSMWRGDFSAAAPILGLVGSLEPLVLDEQELGTRLTRLTDRMTPRDPLLHAVSDVTLFYVGDLTSIRSWVDQFPVNTADHPVIEFSAPISQSRRQTVAGPALESFYWRVQNAPAHDPVRLRRTAASDVVALSALPGNLLFVAVEAGAKQDFHAQTAAIHRAAELLPGSNVLDLFRSVSEATNSGPTRGVALDSRR